MGTGLLLTRKGSDLQTILEGGTGTGSADFVQPSMMPEHLEVGTQNYPGIVGLRAGFAFLQQKKQGALLKQEIGQMQWLYDRLSSMPSIVLYTKRPTVTHHVPVLSFNVKDTDSETVGSYLNSRGIAVRAGLHCAPSAHRSIGTLEQGTVRVSPSAFTTMEELRQFGSQMVRFTKLLQNRF
jgi:selenocysteine lyase/cysteine desulfurase